MGRLAAGTAAKSPVVRKTKRPRTRACDRCGMSEVDGKMIAKAKFEIQVPGGSVFLCGAHFRQHAPHILEKKYEVVNLGA